MQYLLILLMQYLLILLNYCKDPTKAPKTLEQMMLFRDRTCALSRPLRGRRVASTARSARSAAVLPSAAPPGARMLTVSDCPMRCVISTWPGLLSRDAAIAACTRHIGTLQAVAGD